jgi:hypothetical protein
MSAADGTEPVADDEVLYRRVPVSMGWYTPQANPPLSPEAFRPRDEDTDGISLYRAKDKTLEEAARGPSRKGYHVISLRAGDLRARGIVIRPDMDPADPGHVTLPALNTASRDTDRALEIQAALAECGGAHVSGPFIQAPA